MFLYISLILFSLLSGVAARFAPGGVPMVYVLYRYPATDSHSYSAVTLSKERNSSSASSKDMQLPRKRKRAEERDPVVPFIARSSRCPWSSVASMTAILWNRR